jgi:hypothetical protein
VAKFPESLRESRSGAMVTIANPKIGVPLVVVAINEDFTKIDEGAAIAIHVGAGNILPRVARDFAEDMQNQDYLQRTADYLEPIYH